MPKFAPGVAAYDEQNFRRAQHGQQRRADWASGLEGLGSLFNSLAMAGQHNQAFADQQAQANLMMQQSAYDRDQNSQVRDEMGVVPTSPLDQAMNHQAQAPAPTFLGNMGRAFGVGGYQGRITPQAFQQFQQMQLAQQDQQMQQAAAAREENRFPIEIQGLQDRIKYAGEENTRQNQTHAMAMRTIPIENQIRKLGAVEQARLFPYKKLAIQAHAARELTPTGGGTGATSPNNNQLYNNWMKVREDAANLRGLAAAKDHFIDPATNSYRKGVSPEDQLYFMNLLKAVPREAAFLGNADLMKRANELDAIAEQQRPLVERTGLIPPRITGGATGPGMGQPSVSAGAGSEEARLAADPEIAAALNQFKAENHVVDGEPLDVEAFLGWLESAK